MPAERIHNMPPEPFRRSRSCTTIAPVGRGERVALAVVAGAAAVAVLSVVGMLAGRGASTSQVVGTTRAAPASPPGSTVKPTETPAQFLDAPAKALRDGDATFLFTRLHPAVLTRYGESTCRTYTAAQHDATTQFTVTRVGAKGDYAYTTDAQTTTVPNTLTVDVERVANGQRTGHHCARHDHRGPVRVADRLHAVAHSRSRRAA